MRAVLLVLQEDAVEVAHEVGVGHLTVAAVDDAAGDIALAVEPGGVDVLGPDIEAHAYEATGGRDVLEVPAVGDRRTVHTRARELQRGAAEIAQSDAADGEVRAALHRDAALALIGALLPRSRSLSIKGQVADGKVAHTTLLQDTLGAIGAQDRRRTGAHQRDPRRNADLTHAVVPGGDAHDPRPVAEGTKQRPSVIGRVVPSVRRAAVVVGVVGEAALCRILAHGAALHHEKPQAQQQLSAHATTPRPSSAPSCTPGRTPGRCGPSGCRPRSPACGPASWRSGTRSSCRPSSPPACPCRPRR